MKKLFCICITLLTFFVLAAGMFLPVPSAYAEIYEDVAVSFSNPTAITVLGNNLFVADTVREGSGVYTIVHLVTADGTKTLFSDFDNENVSVSGQTLAIEATDRYLFLMQSDKICFFKFATDSYDDILDKGTINCLGLEKIAVADDILYYYFTQQNNFFVGAVSYLDETSITPLQQEVPVRFLIAEDSSQNLAKMFYDIISSTNDRNVAISSGAVVSLPSFGTHSKMSEDVIDLFRLGEDLFGFNDSEVFSVDEETVKLQVWLNGEGILIKDVAAFGDTIYFLCDYSTSAKANDVNKFFNKPRVFRAIRNNTTKEIDFDEVWNIGASELNADIPQFLAENVKKATVSGYPSNVIFAPKKIDLATYDIISKNKLEPTDNIWVVSESVDKKYLFVCLNGAFGWIANSDSKVIFDSTPSLNRLAVVVALTAHIYSLPFDNAEFLTQTQLPRRTAVSVIADAGDLWKISFKLQGQIDTQFGFVKKEAIGLNASMPDYTPYERRTANPAAGQTINLFLTEECDSVEENLCLDDSGKPVSIKSGEEVRLYKILPNGVCLVGVIKNDVLIKGYITNQELLKDFRIGLTNTQVLAIALFAIVALVVVFLVVIRIRAKKLLAVTPTEQPQEKALNLPEDTKSEGEDN